MCEVKFRIGGLAASLVITCAALPGVHAAPGQNVTDSSPEKAAAMLKTELDRWRPLIESMGLKQ